MGIPDAMKRSASRWFSQVTFPEMTWLQFKEFFLTHYNCFETTAATLINMQNGRPKEGECLAAYAAKLMTMTLRLQGLSMEQVAVAMILAHTAQFDGRLQRLAFTMEVDSRDKLQWELHACSFLKRRATVLPSSTFQNVCFSCGKSGHRAKDCRHKRTSSTSNAAFCTTLSRGSISGELLQMLYIRPLRFQISTKP